MFTQSNIIFFTTQNDQGCNKMNRKRGIKRLVFVISVIAISLGIYTLGFYMARTHPIVLDAFFELFINGCCIVALVWVIYDIVLWIIKGFRDEDKLKIPKNKQPY